MARDVVTQLASATRALQEVAIGLLNDHISPCVTAAAARDQARGGSRIGLTIAGALITAHGDTITAASDGPGTGACFTITLPAS